MTDDDPILRLNAALEGRYRIERELGEGGMATVYLADDLRHERKVAVKVLKPELAAVVGAERFLAEIKTTANLQHPHILPLFDSGMADSFLFYVMPYVEGESLRDRLDREHQLPVDDAVQIAMDVAEALEYAHAHGVIHRDIKPANILLHGGRPVISDFGIALAVGAAGGNRLTETGLSMGTPYYMSPEQATGDQIVGPSTDVYALGCVLYEMLVGEPPYTGSTAQAILGKIIQSRPVSATEVRPSVPANVEATVRRSLEKIPADRFTGAHEFARALADGGFRHGETVEAGGMAASRRLWNPLSVALAATTVALGGALLLTATRPDPSQPVTRLSLRLEDNQFPTEWLTLSPDGSTMVMSYPDDEGTWRLWLRRWGDLRATAIPGVGKTGTALNDPVISPDGQEVAYFDDGVLKVAPLGGGLVRTLSDGNCCPRWEDDGYVYFTADSGIIQRVPALGGGVEDVTTLEEGDGSHTYFHVVAGGDVGLFSVASNPARIDALRLATRARSQITVGTRSYFTSTGHLVFATLDGRLLAAPFDPEALELTGAPVPIVEGIHIRTSDPSYTLSEDGTLAFWRAEAQRDGAQFVSISLDGTVTPVGRGMVFEPGTGNPGWALSPDGRRVAYRDVSGGDDGEIWIVELASGQMSRLTFDGGADWAPQWSADGRRVYFLSTRGSTDGGFRLWSKSADGTGDARLEVDTERSMAEFVLSPDQQWVVFRAAGPPSRDLMIKRLGEEGPESPLLASPDFDELAPSISPDGRWLAYASNETGVPQVYVRPFPDVPSGRWQVTSGSGFSVAPRWSHDGTKLFYWDDGLTSVDVDTSNGFRVGPPRDHFPFLATPGLFGSTVVSGIYAIGTDDESVLMARALNVSSDAGEPELILVQNFFEELRRRVPGN